MGIEMKFNRIKEFIIKYLNEYIIEGILSVLILVLLIIYFVCRDSQNISSIIDFTIFFGVAIAFISKFITGIFSSWLRKKIEDQVKLDTNYNRIIKQYPCCSNMLSYTNTESGLFKMGKKRTSCKLVTENTNEHTYRFPVTLECRGPKLEFIIQDSNSQYVLPDSIVSKYDELIAAHNSSDVYNQLNIRLDDYELIESKVKFMTSRTTYFDSLVTNRAMDFKWNNGLSVRDLYAYGPFLPELKNSLLSNHLGFNGFIESVDGDIIFILRSNNVSIGKNTLGTSIGASLKTRYALDCNQKFTTEGLEAGIKAEIKDELCIQEGDYAFTLYHNIISVYRDIVEGGKPQLLFYVKVNRSSREIQQAFSKEIKGKRAKWDFQKRLKQDGNKLVFVAKGDLRRIYIAPDMIIIGDKCYPTMPSVGASLAMFINYLDKVGE